jgi:hypothetical protein
MPLKTDNAELDDSVIQRYVILLLWTVVYRGRVVIKSSKSVGLLFHVDHSRKRHIEPRNWSAETVQDVMLDLWLSDPHETPQYGSVYTNHYTSDFTALLNGNWLLGPKPFLTYPE